MLIAVNYHYIRPSFNLPYPGIHGISPAQFASQLQLLGRAGTFVSGEQVRSAVEGGPPLPERALIVTFDDGLREQFDNAWPVLEELRIPAVFFVNTRPIAEGQMSTVHKIHLTRVHQPPELFVETMLRKANEQGCGDVQQVSDEVATTHYKYDSAPVARLKYLLNFSLPSTVSESIVAEMFDETFAGRQQSMCEQLYMSRSQVAELGRRQAIGSHAHEHLPLGLLDDDAIGSQIAKASTLLQDWAGYLPYALSYPYGSREACSPATAAAAARHGVAFGFTIKRAANASLAQPWQLARFDNNDLPGGKAARWSIEELFESAPQRSWFGGER